eukprot:6656588-Ditylum_brightwellii.AAC.1
MIQQMTFSLAYFRNNLSYVRTGKEPMYPYCYKYIKYGRSRTNVDLLYSYVGNTTSILLNREWPPCWKRTGRWVLVVVITRIYAQRTSISNMAHKSIGLMISLEKKT